MQCKIAYQQKQLAVPWGTHGLFVRESPTLGLIAILEEGDGAFLQMDFLVLSAFDSARSFSVGVAYLTTKEQRSEYY